VPRVVHPLAGGIGKQARSWKRKKAGGPVNPHVLYLHGNLPDLASGIDFLRTSRFYVASPDPGFRRSAPHHALSLSAMTFSWPASEGS
jgi:hypothetical protein